MSGERRDWRSYKPSEQAQLAPVANHEAFLRDVNEACAEAAAAGHPLACVFVDADHFKSVNDNWGHDAGDRVIKGIGKLLREAVGERGKCYRCGGEEFIALLPNFDEVEAAAFGERVRRAVATVEWGPEMPPKTTVSVGVAEHGEPFLPGNLAKRADAAMYEAKHGGRDQVATFSGMRLTLSTMAARREGPLIAIVDAEKFICDILADFLGIDGYRVATFKDGSEIICSTERPAAMFASLELPDLKGASIVKTLRARFEGKPVVAMSGRATPEEIVECFRAGASDFAIKPFKIEEMTALALRLAGPTDRHTWWSGVDVARGRSLGRLQQLDRPPRYESEDGCLRNAGSHLRGRLTRHEIESHHESGRARSISPVASASSAHPRSFATLLHRSGERPTRRLHHVTFPRLPFCPKSAQATFHDEESDGMRRNSRGTRITEKNRQIEDKFVFRKGLVDLPSLEFESPWGRSVTSPWSKARLAVDLAGRKSSRGRSPLAMTGPLPFD
jgi:diguanylate cyclase (GGDEF)-like protein